MQGKKTIILRASSREATAPLAGKEGSELTADLRVYSSTYLRN
jgi:hypothetical protein